MTFPEGDAAAAVAARWGFGPATRFTSFYREHLEVSPSRTLNDGLILTACGGPTRTGRILTVVATHQVTQFRG